MHCRQDAKCTWKFLPVFFVLALKGNKMEILTKNIRKVYRKYLFASFGSAIIASIYVTVDMVATGQYEGPPGAAALSVISPMWNVFMGMGILLGIGGSILMSKLRGEGDERQANEYFTASILLGLVMSVIITLLFAFYKEHIAYLCGADELIVPYVLRYAKWLTAAIPFFLMGTILSAFIRNDEAPYLATISMICGGVLNIFGDIFFVFVWDMGIEGAAVATLVGQIVAVLILCSYFLSKKCNLRIIKPVHFYKKLKQIIAMGISPFIVEISFGVIVILFNNQIMRYFGTTELAVFGVIINIAILVQALFYSVGQAIQPIISANLGAGQYERINSVLRFSMGTAAMMGLVFFSLIFIFPQTILKIYMDTTSEILLIGPAIMRDYAWAFLLMGINIVASYYFQSLMESKKSLIISVLRGFFLCSGLVLLLPVTAGRNAIWWTMPITEMLTMLVVFILIYKSKQVG